MEIDIDGDTFTRSTSTLTVGSSSNLPLLDMSGDTDLIHRQEAARDTMIKNNISLDRDAKIPGRRNNNCTMCFKNRGTFTFQGRAHIQMNKTTKGAKLKWYCPLADSQEQYSALLKKRRELKQKRNERSNERGEQSDGVLELCSKLSYFNCTIFILPLHQYRRGVEIWTGEQKTHI